MALFAVVANRVDVERVFESRECLQRLVVASGGAVRDLMRLVRLSCYTAGERILDAHVGQAISSLVLEYSRLIKDEHLGRLVQVANQHRAPNDDMSAWLLHQRLVLEYQNDQRWADLHPAVRASPLVQERLSTRAKARQRLGV